MKTIITRIALVVLTGLLFLPLAWAAEDELKDKTGEVEYDGSGTFRKKTTFTYDANGNRLSEIETDEAGNLIKKSVYTYNDRNLKTGKMQVAGSKQKDRSKKWEYVYY